MSLMSEIDDYQNIHLAYWRVIKSSMNKELICNHEQEIFTKCIPKIYEDLRNCLRDDDYSFLVLEQLNKPKYLEDDGSWVTRPLVRMNFFDSVVAQTLTNVLAEELRSLLPYKNYSYKLMPKDSLYMYQDWKKGYAKFVESEINAVECDKYKFVIETDIEQFYPSIDHDILMNDLATCIGLNSTNEDNEKFLRWIEKIIKIPNRLINNEIQNPKGLPQGPLYSPLLALFYIRNCFAEIQRKFPGVLYFGYVDDLRVYCQKENQTKDVLELMNKFMSERGLKLSEKKTDIYPVHDEKIIERKVMGRASNLGRAIKDDVVTTSESKEQIRKRLIALKDEVAELYATKKQKKAKFIDKITRFVDYRLIRLIESKEEWNRQINENFSVASIGNNFQSIWYALYLGADSTNDKRNLICKTEELLEAESIQNLTYVQYLIHQYLFKFSPFELQLDDEAIKTYIEKHLNGVNDIFLKASFSYAHEDWNFFFKKYKKVLHINSKDLELQLIFYVLGLKTKPPLKYANKSLNPRLALKNNKGKSNLLYNYPINEIIDYKYSSRSYLNNSSFKILTYKKMDNAKENWTVELGSNTYAVMDLKGKLSERDSHFILEIMASWIHVKLKHEQQRLPCSVIDPNHIFIKQLINRSADKIFIYGNPAWDDDCLFENKTPNKIWQKNFARLFEALFDVSLLKDIHGQTFLNYKILSDTPYMVLKTWQYRVLNFLLEPSFSVESFIDNILNILSEEETSSKFVEYELYRLNNITKHYVNDVLLRDKLIKMDSFVEGCWKNGSKDCYYFTLHNHEHARFLISIFHKINEAASFAIYLNRKEAFRLFSSCYLHDIGMLQEPSWVNSNININGYEEVFLQVIEMLNQAAPAGENKCQILPFIEEMFIRHENAREQLIRDNHHRISEQEILFNLPDINLNTVEKRDIAIISAAHMKEEADLNLIDECVYDEKHPINLKLLSILLRLMDSCDVSRERIRKEFLERNYSRMSEDSKFHWIKHSNVDELKVRSDMDNEEPNICISIEHSYIPFGALEKDPVFKRCGEKCEDNRSNYEKYYMDMDNLFGNEKSERKCNLTCAFINKAYYWFFEEVKRTNKYFKEIGINIVISLLITRQENAKNDVNYYCGNDLKESAQQFMIRYLNDKT